MTAQKAFALGFPVPFCSLGRKWLKLLAALQWGHLCLISPGGKEGAGALKRLKAFQSSERDQRWRRREGTAPSPPPKLTRRLECKRPTAHTLALLFHCHGAPHSAPHLAPFVMVGTPSRTAAPPCGIHGTPISCLRGKWLFWPSPEGFHIF